MTIPTTGSISLGMVAQELGVAKPLSLGDSRVRTLAGKASGAISLTDLRGKTHSTYVLPTIDCETIIDRPVLANIGAFVVVNYAAAFSIIGGEAPFTVTWARLSGLSTVTVSGTTSPIFETSGTVPFNSSAQFRATVTDNRSNVVQSPPIDVTLRADNEFS